MTECNFDTNPPKVIAERALKSWEDIHKSWSMGMIQQNDVDDNFLHDMDALFKALTRLAELEERIEGLEGLKHGDCKCHIDAAYDYGIDTAIKHMRGD